MSVHFNTPQDAFARLINLRNQCGETLYERLKLADLLLSDRRWVEDPVGGGGHEGLAIDRLESECFGDLCGALSLPEMLEVLKAVPQVSVWKTNKYNLRKMHAEMKARQGAAREAQTPKPSAGNDARHTPNPTLSLVQENTQLRRQNRELKEQVALLTKQNKQLKKAVRKLQESIPLLQGIE